jgi:hypothetical protein
VAIGDSETTKRLSDDNRLGIPPFTGRRTERARHANAREQAYLRQSRGLAQKLLGQRNGEPLQNQPKQNIILVSNDLGSIARQYQLGA